MSVDLTTHVTEGSLEIGDPDPASERDVRGPLARHGVRGVVAGPGSGVHAHVEIEQLCARNDAARQHAALARAEQQRGAQRDRECRALDESVRVDGREIGPSEESHVGAIARRRVMAETRHPVGGERVPLASYGRLRRRIQEQLDRQEGALRFGISHAPIMSRREPGALIAATVLSTFVLARRSGGKG